MIEHRHLERPHMEKQKQQSTFAFSLFLEEFKLLLYTQKIGKEKRKS